MALLGVTLPTRMDVEEHRPKSTNVKKALFHSKALPSRKVPDPLPSYTQLISNTKKPAAKNVKPSFSAAKTGSPLKRGGLATPKPKPGTATKKSSATKMGLDMNRNNMVTPASKKIVKTSLSTVKRTPGAATMSAGATAKGLRTPASKPNSASSLNGRTSQRSTTVVTGKPPIKKLPAKNHKIVSAKTEVTAKRTAAAAVLKVPVKNKSARTVSPDENKAVDNVAVLRGTVTLTPPPPSLLPNGVISSRATPSLKVKNLNSVTAAAKSAGPKLKAVVTSTKVNRTSSSNVKLPRSTITSTVKASLNKGCAK